MRALTLTLLAIVSAIWLAGAAGQPKVPEPEPGAAAQERPGIVDAINPGTTLRNYQQLIEPVELLRRENELAYRRGWDDVVATLNACKGRDINWVLPVQFVGSSGILVERYEYQTKVYRYKLTLATRNREGQLLSGYLTGGYGDDFAIALRHGDKVRVIGKVKDVDFGYVTALFLELADGYRVGPP